MNARLRPQRKQRRTTLDLNFGGRFERATVDFLAIFVIDTPDEPGYSPYLESYDSAVCLAFPLSGTYQKKGAQTGRAKIVP